MHDAVRIISILIPLLLLIPLFMFLRSMTKTFKPFESATTLTDIRDIRSQADLRYLEQQEFQRELLIEFRRHNAVLERQADLLTQLLEHPPK